MGGVGFVMSLPGEIAILDWCGEQKNMLFYNQMLAFEKMDSKCLLSSKKGKVKVAGDITVIANSKEPGGQEWGRRCQSDNTAQLYIAQLYSHDVCATFTKRQLPHIYIFSQSWLWSWQYFSLYVWGYDDRENDLFLCDTNTCKFDGECLRIGDTVTCVCQFKVRR